MFLSIIDITRYPWYSCKVGIIELIAWFQGAFLRDYLWARSKLIDWRLRYLI